MRVFVCARVWSCDSLKHRFPLSQIPSSPFVPHPGQAGFPGSSGGNIKWPGSLQQTQVIREGSFHSLPSLASSHPLPAFKCGARSKLWGCVPETSPPGMLEAQRSSLQPDFAPSIFFTSSCSIIFISLARAFTAINTVSKVGFLFFPHAAIH